MIAWIDIDNAPHVAIFAPIIRDLEAQGARVHVTARARTYVTDLLGQAGIVHDVIGQGQPRGFLAKATAVGLRSLALARWARGRRLDVAVGHGSRSLPIAARMAGVPNLTTFDYEHISTSIFERFCDRIVLPRVVLDATGKRGAPWASYEGFKEEVYLSEAPRNTSARAALGIRDESILAVVRPPSRTAHYHNSLSEEIEAALLERVDLVSETRIVWLRRDPGDPVPSGKNIVAPDLPVHGVSLLAAADLVISGGGTMTREAALLGTPAYSIFTGPTGAVDMELARRGWLSLIRTPSDVDKIEFVRKSPTDRPRTSSRVREELLTHIIATARHSTAPAREVSWESPSSI